MNTAPDPTTLDRADAQTHTMHVCVLVVGDASEGFVAAALGAISQGAAVDLVRSDEPPSVYAATTLGAIRGWTPVVHLFALGGDARVGQWVQRHASRADALIVAEPADATSPSDATRALAAKVALAAIHVPSAVYANDALGRQWNALTDRTPVAVAAAEPAHAAAVFKAVVKLALASQRRSDSVPPA